MRFRIAILALALVAASSAAKGTEYSFVELPPPLGGDPYNIADINNLGNVLCSGGYAPYARSVEWNGTTNVVLPSQSGYGMTTAYRVNDANCVVGSVDSTYSHRAAKWVQGNLQLLDLGPLAGSQSTAAAINNAGWIAGTSVLSGDVNHLYTISPSGAVQDRGSLPGSFYGVHDINAAGQIVIMDDLTLMHACVWQNGQLTNLPDINGGTYSAAYAINDSGLVVGASWPYQQNAKAATWLNGAISLLSVPNGTTESWACDVNNSGQIVGYYSLGSAPTHACVWDADGTFHDLSVEALSLPQGTAYASRINDVGQIAVRSGLSGPTYLLTPVPEPSALALLGISVVVLVGYGRRWRRK
jgi:uncharacterized membrane protein